MRISELKELIQDLPDDGVVDIKLSNDCDRYRYCSVERAYAAPNKNLVLVTNPERRGGTPWTI